MISIIVPVYKVEKFLRKCIDSVLAQTYQDWELLLIDDGSPDSCPAICDDYARRDARIHAIHKENGGVSSARNAGLDVARGEYIMFLDSDDTLEKEALGTCIRKAEESGADIVQFQAMETDEEGKTTKALSEIKNDEIITNYEYSSMVMQSSVLLVIWDKLYKRSVIGDKRFIEGVKIGEDFLFLVNVFCYSSCSIIRIKDHLYNYRILPTSATRNTSNNDLKNWDLLLDGFVNQNNAHIEETGENNNELVIEKIAIFTIGSIRRQGFIKHVTARHRNIIKEQCPIDYIHDKSLRHKITVLQNDKHKLFADCYFTCIYLKQYIRRCIRHILK